MGYVHNEYGKPIYVPWRDYIAKLGEDIADYLKRRYKDYCIDRKEEGGIIWGGGVAERHEAKQKQLFEYGIKLYNKLSFWLEKSRKKLFESCYKRLEFTDRFINVEYAKFCREVDKTVKDDYENRKKKKEKKKILLDVKEMIRDKSFIDIIDERRAEYNKKVAMIKRRKAVIVEIKEALKEKIKIKKRREGYSNVKPVEFYAELYKNNEEDHTFRKFNLEQMYDKYFEDTGTLNGVWREVKLIHSYGTKKVWRGDGESYHDRPEIYTSFDNPLDNQEFLNRCKELRKMIGDLGLFDEEFNKDFKEEGWVKKLLDEGDILQEYLSKGYLITRQIPVFAYKLNYWLRELVLGTFKLPSNIIRDHPARKYNIDIFSNYFTIGKIKEDICRFIETTKNSILTPYKELVNYLKKHGNEVTVAEYSSFIGKSYKVALRILKVFRDEKKLKSKKIAHGKLVFYI